MLTIWWIGWFFTLGLTNDFSAKQIALCAVAWPVELGQYIRGKIE